MRQNANVMRLRQLAGGAILASMSAVASHHALACSCFPNPASPEIFVARIVRITEMDGTTVAKARPRSIEAPGPPVLLRYEAIKVLRGTSRTTGTLEHEPFSLCGAPANVGETYIFYLRARDDKYAPPCSFVWVLPKDVDSLGKR